MSVCPLVMTVSPDEMAEWIKMPLMRPAHSHWAMYGCHLANIAEWSQTVAMRAASTVTVATHKTEHYPPVVDRSAAVGGIPRTGGSVGFVSPPVARPQLNYVHQHRTQVSAEQQAHQCFTHSFWLTGLHTQLHHGSYFPEFLVPAHTIVLDKGPLNGLSLLCC